MNGQTEWVIVPKAALEWLNGEAADPAGYDFGDFPEDHPKPPGAFWWRRIFKDICDHYERAFPKPNLALDSGTGGQQPVANDAPARLWLSAADADNEHQLWFDPDEGGTPYVRADLASPMMDIEEIIDAVMESERYEPKVVPMGANPPLFDGMQPDNDGPWVSRVDVAKRLRVALTAAKGREDE